MSAEQKIQKDVPLKNYTTFGIGGPAAYFLEIHTQEEAVEAMAFASKEGCPFIVIGKGSNALFDDRGYRGLVILNKIQGVIWKDSSVEVGSGYSFSLLGIQTARKGLSGLEFAAGIPGSVGGAVFMNAGANKQEVCNVITSVGFVDAEGMCKTYLKEDVVFSYRHSSFQGLKGCITSATFNLRPWEEARKQQLDIIAYRTQTQPYGEKSAGCVFRNPEYKSAGALIESVGLKGYKVGGACVSSLHANFIVNEGFATAQDVLELAAFIKAQVFKQTGDILDMEVVCIPYDGVKR